MSDLIERLIAATEGTTPGPWSGHNMVHEDGGRQMTPEEIGEYVCNAVKMGDLTRFLFISGKHDDGGDCDVCHTGNGPRGPANTHFIAAARQLVPEAAAALAAKDAEIARLARGGRKARGLVAEALTLALRGRHLAEIADADLRPHPTAPRSATIPAWAQEHYERDLRDWEDRARAALTGEKGNG